MADTTKKRNRLAPQVIVTGAQLKALRQSLGMTQAVAAARCGLALQSYQRIEAGASPARALHAYQTLSKNPFDFAAELDAQG